MTKNIISTSDFHDLPKEKRDKILNFITIQTKDLINIFLKKSTELENFTTELLGPIGGIKAENTLIISFLCNIIPLIAQIKNESSEDCFKFIINSTLEMLIAAGDINCDEIPDKKH